MAGHATHQPIEVLEHGLVNEWLKLTKHGATKHKNTVSKASLPDPVLPEKKNNEGKKTVKKYDTPGLLASRSCKG